MFAGDSYEVSQLGTRAHAVTACKYKPGVRLVVIDLALDEAEQLIRDIEALAPEMLVIVFSTTEISPTWNSKLRHDFGNIGEVYDQPKHLAVGVHRLMTTQHH